MKYEDLREEFLSDPEVKKEYDALELEYKIKRLIIEARIQKDLTQKELAELVGTQQANISRLENGTYNPSINFLKKIAGALGKKVEINFI